MAVTTAMCASFRQELLAMTPHTAADIYRLVLIRGGHAGTYGASTTNVGTPGTGAPGSANIGTDAVAVSGDYNSVNGITLAGFTVTLDSGTAVLTFNDPAALTGTTISADGAILYNSSRSNRAVAVFSFGGTITSTAGPFDINLPAATAAAGLIRV